MKKTSIVPAIIASKQEELDEALSKVPSVKRIQLDVMDGKFVHNKSIHFNFNVKKGKHLYEAHLMIEDVEKWVEENSSKVDVIIPHYSAIRDRIDSVIALIKSKGKVAGLAINPEVKVDDVECWDKIDHILVMTVHPGAYGSAFLPEMLDKVKVLRSRYPDKDIEVDGGMNLENTKLAKSAGANIIVSGSFIMKADDPLARVKELEEA